MKRIAFATLVVAFILGGDIPLEAIDSGGTRIQNNKGTSASGLPIRTKMNINEISSWYDNDGTEEYNSSTGNSGLVYPQGTAGAIFAAGLMWSGEFLDGQTPTVRTNGHAYNTGLVPGAILGVRTGVIEDPAADDVRIWRVRRNYNSADLARDAAEINSVGLSSVSEAQITAVRDQYEKDWLEWPAAKGAPFYDADSDGVYTPMIVDGVPVLFPTADEPGIADADQVIWYTANDIGNRSPWGATPPGGLEMQLTIWGYARADALGNVLFKKYRLIYKGTGSTPADAAVENMYLSQWSDPDLGNAADDYAGCDITLSLGFCYNANPTDSNFDDFGIRPPAVGYDFLQGPLVPGVAGEDRNNNGIDDATDTGIFDLKVTSPGFINLPMTSFIYFAAGGTYSDPLFTYPAALQWNCMLQGLPPTPQPPPCPEPPLDPYTNQPAGKYWLYAGSDGSSSPDPNNPTGWVDGQIDGPGDRRLILASGPFTMALGDTQELVSAVVTGLGTTNLKSVQVLKFNDKSVQLAYDNLFDLPKPPANPDVSVIPFDQSILLDWESNSTAVSTTEDIIFRGGYTFEGYKVYQVPNSTASVADGILLATYDVVNDIKTIFQETFDPISGEILNLPVQFGTDSGVERTFVITRDEFRSAPVVNGTPYYFAVTAYNYTAENQPIKTLESPLLIFTAIPGAPDPGTRYPYEIDDTVSTVNDVSGVNDAVVQPVIFAPTRQFGETFEVRFDTLTGGIVNWSLFESGQPDTIVNAMPITTDTTIRLIDNGFTLKVSPAPVGVRSVLDENGVSVFGPDAISETETYRILGKSTDINSLGGGGTNTGRTYEIRMTDDSSFAISIATPAFSSRAIKVPFRVFDVGRSVEDSAVVEVMAVVRDHSASIGTWNVSTIPVTQNGVTFSVFEPMFISTYSYVSDDPLTPVREDSTAVKANQNNLISVGTNTNNVRNAVDSVYIADLDGDGLAPPAGTTIAVNKFREIRAGDVKSIQLESVIAGDVTIARNDVTLINVFPNPYYGLNSRETSSQVRFVTFNHLPDVATIRIFNLTGILVRTLIKDANSTNPTSPQHFTWNLQNDNGLPVASGIYLIHMELKDAAGTDLGQKILKLAIIQEQQFLPNY